MSSITEVCNWALTKLGEPLVLEWDEDSTQGKLLRVIYPLVRDEVQASFPWKSLKRRASIAASADTNPWGYQYIYNLPADLLFLGDVRESASQPLRNWEMEGRTVTTDFAGPLLIRYQKRSDDPSEWGPLLTAVVACKIAVELSEKICQDPNKRSLAWREYNLAMESATKQSSLQAEPTNINDPSPWEEARVGGVYPWFGSGDTL